ncbi:hypothetical protein P355_1316 [Burkholderia cenocepacia KC-01]|nr:hypothetical protein P355_1316 [Burkholderia cenocepacia KC-01]
MDGPHVALLLELFEPGESLRVCPAMRVSETRGYPPVRTLNFTYLCDPRIEPVPSAKTLGKTSTNACFPRAEPSSGTSLNGAAGSLLARGA